MRQTPIAPLSHLLNRPFIPVPLTPLVGREHERAVIRDILTDSKTRLITLTGAGGVGKTRLALDVARAVTGDFAGRIWFVPLASLADSSLVLATIAEMIGLPAAEDAETVERLRHALGPAPALAVLDNFEHLIAAAPRLAAVLEACPGLRMLVTSREALRVRGEREFLVPPLTLPEAGSQSAAVAAQSEAVALYVQRTREVRPDFVLTDDNAPAVIEICRRLDGLPLAIELAAARGRVLPPAVLVGRIEQRLSFLTGGARDLPARQQTMRAAIAWSYDLLTSEEQALFRRLSVFAGGFTLDAAGAVCEGLGNGKQGTDEGLRPVPSSLTPAPAVFDGIASLLDKNLLRQTEGSGEQPRYAMLETIREFGLDQLWASGESEDVRRRHASWYCELADQLWKTLYREPVDPARLRQVEAEHDNFRAALAWLEQSDDLVGFLALAGAIGPFWFFRSHWAEGSEWLRRGLQRLPDPRIPPAIEARALHIAGSLAEGQPEAAYFLEQSIRIWDELGDHWGVAASRDVLAKQANGQGQYDRGLTYAAAAIPVFADCGDTVWLADATAEFGLAAFGQGRIDDALAEIERALGLARQADDRYGLGLTLQLLALVAGEGGDLTRSFAAYREALDVWSRVGMKEGITAVMAGIASLAVKTGRTDVAARLFGAADNLAFALGYRLPLPQSAIADRARAAARDAFGAAAFDAARAAGAAIPLRDAIAEAAVCAAQPNAVDVAAAGPVPRQSGENPAGLTPRELEVIRLLAEGKSDREIGETLCVSRATTARHVANILLKLDVNSRTQAAAYAFRHGLV